MISFDSKATKLALGVHVHFKTTGAYNKASIVSLNEWRKLVQWLSFFSFSNDYTTSNGDVFKTNLHLFIQYRCRSKKQPNMILAILNITKVTIQTFIDLRLLNTLMVNIPNSCQFTLRFVLDTGDGFIIADFGYNWIIVFWCMKF